MDFVNCVLGSKNGQGRENPTLGLLLNCRMCLQLGLISCGGLQLYFSNEMKENTWAESHHTENQGGF